ncbi:Inner membrane metabolite transport protein YhjE [Corynebacterium atrinae]|uniref:MFS transporter n=1 Tax=Corynebacterium atrinae TaxID=1336740 RepID=UPI0025B4CB59|nr:MFS transporter [Corynebacterium atrinae]WJY64638.1 Inner membrane metabolite transport protein YhjE [Corynebacterium atrinae]
MSKSSPSERRRVVAATTIGTAIEWYDFFLYASVAGLVFNHIMFGGLEPGLATIVSFLSVGLSFLFRPLGAVLAGHFADRYGRKFVLMVTLLAMGGATTLIGLVPTFDTIGVWAPLLLILFRIIQGISAGGEWGSAVLLSVEHAPADKRGIFGAGPQAGAPAGLLLSSGMLALMNIIAPGEAFFEWGWRIPFLLSIVLVGLGYWIRRGVDESPVFEEISERRQTSSPNPLADLFRRFFPVVFVGALVFAGNGVVGYMIAGGYVQSYAVGQLEMERGTVLWAVAGAAVAWLMSTVFTGWVSDRVGRKRAYLVGFGIQAVAAAVLFPLVNTGEARGLWLAMVLLGLALGATYGQQAAMYAELFPASVRGSGASITYALGSILGGAFAPTIAASVVRATGSTSGVTIYLLVATVVGFLAVLSLRDRTGIPLGPEHEEEQSTAHFIHHR